jgi:hypothetical protein
MERERARPGAVGVARSNATPDTDAAVRARHSGHETWHVVQQKQGRVQPTSTDEGASVNESPALEAEAEADAAGAQPSTKLVSAEPTDGKFAAAPRATQSSRASAVAQFIDPDSGKNLKTKSGYWIRITGKYPRKFDHQRARGLSPIDRRAHRSTCPYSLSSTGRAANRDRRGRSGLPTIPVARRPRQPRGPPPLARALHAKCDLSVHRPPGRAMIGTWEVRTGGPSTGSSQ